MAAILIVSKASYTNATVRRLARRFRLLAADDTDDTDTSADPWHPCDPRLETAEAPATTGYGYAGDFFPVEERRMAGVKHLAVMELRGNRN